MRMQQHLLGHQRGSTFIEVMVTLVILAFGLLGLAGLHAKIHVLDLESFQRGQAVILLNDMAERISANLPNASNYVSTTPIGTLDSEPTSCASIATGPARDVCEWSNQIKGAAETSGGNPIGAMIGGRGCITAFALPASAANTIMGMCQTGIQIDVVWQGTTATVVPSVSCGSGLYGANDAYRRAISSRIVTGVTPC